jgi:hypothetical protein
MKLDEAATAAWNEWFEKGFQNHLGPYVDQINSALKNINEEIDATAGETNTALDELSKDLAKVVTHLETKVSETRATMSNELRVELESARKRLWDDLILKFGADMNIMLADTRSLIRKNIEDEVREVVRKEIESEVREVVRKEIREQLTKRRQRYSRGKPPPNVTDTERKAPSNGSQ